MPIFERLYEKCKLFISNNKGEYLPFEKFSTVCPVYDCSRYIEPKFDYNNSWSANLKGIYINKKGMAQLLSGFNKYKTRKIIRHLEWWRRYALKTGEKPRDAYQCYLEVTGRAWRPKMPKARGAA